MGVLIAGCSSRAHRVSRPAFRVVAITGVSGLRTRRAGWPTALCNGKTGDITPSPLYFVTTALGYRTRLLSSLRLLPAARPGLGRLQPRTHRGDGERSRQAEGPQESPLSLGEGETLGPPVQISATARKAPARIGQNLALSGDDTEQPVLRVPGTAANARTRGHAAVSRIDRQASHALSYPHDHPSRSPAGPVKA